MSSLTFQHRGIEFLDLLFHTPIRPPFSSYPGRDREKKDILELLNCHDSCETLSQALNHLRAKHATSTITYDIYEGKCCLYILHNSLSDPSLPGLI